MTNAAGKISEIPQFVENLKRIRHQKIDELRSLVLVEDEEESKKLEISQIERSLAEIRKMVDDPESHFLRFQTRIAELEDLLERSTVDIGANRIQDAKAALEAGDTTKADTIFAEVEEFEQAAVERKADAAMGRGLIAENDVRWRDAAKHYEDAARLHPTFDSLRKAGEFLWRSGSPVRALRYNLDLMDLTNLTYGAESSEFALALNNLALRHKDLGEFQKAEALYRQALAIDEKTLDGDHPDNAVRLNNLGSVLMATGRYEEAEVLFRQALAIDERTVGVNHPDYAIDLNNLGNLLRKIGRHGEAEELFRQALAIDAKTLGVDHPDYATDVNNLANVLYLDGRYDEAEDLYRQALEIDEKTLGRDHPAYATRLNNLANVLLATGRIEKAEAALREALSVFETVLGADHPDTKTVRSGLDALIDQQSQ